MSPITKKNISISSRELPLSAARTVPKVATSSVSKPASASAKKQAKSKLGELGLKSQIPITSTAASNEAGSPDIIEIDDPLDLDFSTQESIPNNQMALHPRSSTQDIDVSFSAPDWALDFQKQLRSFQSRFESQESRLQHLESLIQENSELKKTVSTQASLIAELKARLLAVSSSEVVEDQMLLDTPRDLSSNASKWKDAPSAPAPKATPKAAPKVPAQVPKSAQVPPKPTMAQVVAAANKKKAPAKKVLSATKLATIARPFVTNTGPSGFKFVYIGRSRKITRADTRSRFKQCGIDNSRVLDINFPAHGVIGVLVHVQYADTFASVMKKVGAELITSFDPLDPDNLANPIYASYSEEARMDVAIELQHNRCINALKYLSKSRPYQVKPVGSSLVELGYISAEDVAIVASSIVQDSKAKADALTGALFTSSKNIGPGSIDKMETDTGEGGSGAVGEATKSSGVDSDGEMSDIDGGSDANY